MIAFREKRKTLERRGSSSQILDNGRKNEENSTESPSVNPIKENLFKSKSRAKGRRLRRRNSMF